MIVHAIRSSAQKKKKDQATRPSTPIDVQDRVDERRVSFDREETGCDPCCALTIEWHRPGWSTRGGNAPCRGGKALRSDPWSGRLGPLFLRQVNQPTKSIIMRADYRPEGCSHLGRRDSDNAGQWTRKPTLQTT